MKEVILVTGNTGYIGTLMTAFLKRKSYGVVGLDSGWFMRKIFFPAAGDYLPDRQIIKDIRDVAEEDLSGINAVAHLAGLSNDPLGELNPYLTDEINHKATIKLAELCKKRGVDRFIFASSCSIYGIAPTDKPVDERSCLNPITAYAKAKVDCEIALAKMADADFHPTFMRNATVYGVSPRLRLDLVVNNLLAWAYLTGEITIMSDGTPWRPIVHIEDLCMAFAAVIEAPIDKIHCEAFNIGFNTENYRVKDIAEEIQKALPQSKIKILNKMGPDERTYKVDFSKIQRVFSEFRPRHNLKKGIKELREAYTKYNLTQDDFNSDKYFRIRTIKSLLESGEMASDLMLTGGRL